MGKSLQEMMKDRILMAINSGFLTQEQYNRLLDNYVKVINSHYMQQANSVALYNKATKDIREIMGEDL